MLDANRKQSEDIFLLEVRGEKGSKIENHCSRDAAKSRQSRSAPRGPDLGVKKK